MFDGDGNPTGNASTSLGIPNPMEVEAAAASPTHNQSHQLTPPIGLLMPTMANA